MTRDPLFRSRLHSRLGLGEVINQGFPVVPTGDCRKNRWKSDIDIWGSLKPGVAEEKTNETNKLWTLGLGRPHQLVYINQIKVIQKADLNHPKCKSKSPNKSKSRLPTKANHLRLDGLMMTEKNTQANHLTELSNPKIPFGC